MTEVAIPSAVPAARPSLLIASIGFLGSTIALTVLLVALSRL